MAAGFQESVDAAGDGAAADGGALSGRHGGAGGRCRRCSKASQGLRCGGWKRLAAGAVVGGGGEGGEGGERRKRRERSAGAAGAGPKEREARTRDFCSL
jgi:hypothetical protein